MINFKTLFRPASLLALGSLISIGCGDDKHGTSAPLFDMNFNSSKHPDNQNLALTRTPSEILGYWERVTAGSTQDGGSVEVRAKIENSRMDVAIRCKDQGLEAKTQSSVSVTIDTDDQTILFNEDLKLHAVVRDRRNEFHCGGDAINGVDAPIVTRGSRVSYLLGAGYLVLGGRSISSGTYKKLGDLATR